MRTLAFAVVALLAVASPSRADTILVGTPGPGAGQDCIPFGCGIHMQFIYDASYFSGPISIDTLTFFNSVVDIPDNFSGPFTMTLSTTASTVAAPSNTFATNLGADAQLFSVFNPGVGTAIPGTFSISGTPFDYNPANGNLLLDITSPDSPFSGFTDYNSGAGFNVSRVWTVDGSPSGDIDLHYGPVTQFEGDPIPEPGTLTLLGIGLCSVAAGLRRRKQQSRV